MILVTGANGQLARAVVENLLLRVPADQVAVSLRDPGKAGHLAARGVEVRTADFDQPEGLDHAFAGADQMLIVSADKLGDEAALLHRAALLPLEKPVCTVFSTPVTWVQKGGHSFLPADRHALTERDLATFS